MPDFNGNTLIITLDSGVTVVDTEKDLYSAWKEWQLDDTQTRNNRKYPQAFRTVGGDELTPGIDAGAYFFLQNQLGWRIRPAEEDATILLTGNLTPEDSSLPILIPTIGDFSVLIAGLQPITQSVDKILTQQQDAQYQGKVFINFTNGESGLLYPTGLESNPVNNNLDAHNIGQARNITHHVISNGIHILQLQDHQLHQFTGLGGFAAVDIAGFDVVGSIFTSIQLIGSDFTNTTGAIRINRGSILSGATNLNALVENSGLNGTITLAIGATNTFINCYSFKPGPETPIIDCNNNINVLLQMRNYNGGIELRNYTDAGNLASFDLNSSHLILASGCTAGTIVVRGIGRLTDNSTTGCTVITDGFVQGDYLTELWKIKGLDVNNPLTLTTISDNEVDMTSDDVDVKITDAGTIRTVQRQ